jgi:type II secretory pathway component PulJ
MVEFMVATAIFSVTSVTIATVFIFCIRSFAAVTNYAVLDQYNRQAMDLITRELRQAVRITGYSSNATTRTLSFLNGNTQNVTFTFDSGQNRFTRSDVSGTRTVLTNCNLLDFRLFTRPRAANSFDDFPVNMISNWQSTVKIVQMTWKTSLSICPYARVTSEDVQTAKIVIRKQQD